jgi:hypothetical protein
VLLLGEDGTWFRRDYERAFAEAGYAVEFVPTEAPEDEGDGARARDALSASRARIRAQVSQAVSRATPALFFCYAYDRSLDANTLRLVRRLPCPSVLLHVDLEGQWYHSVRSCGAFTLVAAAQRAHFDALRRRGARVLYWPMAGFASKPDFTAPRSPAVRFVGFPSPARIAALRALAASGVPIEVYGSWSRATSGVGADAGAGAPAPAAARSARSGLSRAVASIAGRARRGLHAVPAIVHEDGLMAAWGRRRASSAPAAADHRDLEPWLRGPVPTEALPRTLAGAVVTLGCSETAAGGRRGRRMMRLRDFEAPLAGACHLTQASPGLEDCYDLGREVLTWEEPGDLVETAKACLADPAKCLEVARAGWTRAAREHTYAARLRVLFDALKAPSAAGAAS